jgi:large subunit ribosomal protein L15
MKLSELSPAAGSVTEPKRKGRGPGSGNGKTAGKGHKGQNARSGGGVRPGFEGGQIPLYRRLPKRGFFNRFGEKYAVINVGKLAKYSDGDVVDLSSLESKHLVSTPYKKLKVLGGGELAKKITVKASVFSASAKEKIEAAGGKAEVV